MCGVLKEGERKNDKEISETRTLDGKERCVENGALMVSGSSFDWTKWEDMGEVEDTTNKQNQTSGEECLIATIDQVPSCWQLPLRL